MQRLDAKDIFEHRRYISKFQVAGLPPCLPGVALNSNMTKLQQQKAITKIKDGKIASEEVLMKNMGRVRVVRQAPDGFIYVGTEEPGGVFSITPSI